ncbi:Exocyst complex component 5 [Dinochytrium kinnereticum]|nr:Exocyst complex component 5 [Dinochytrium kinnereticum]
MDSFKGSFSAKQYIEQCSKKTVTAGRKPSLSAEVGFDPKPLIRAFEGSLDELLRLRRKVQNKIDDLDDAAKASEVARKRKLAELQAAIEDVKSAFQALESHLGMVGKTAIRIGEQLETIDKQRTRAVEARDLIQYFLDFNKDEGHFRLEEYRKSGNDSELKSAVIARRLAALAKELDAPGTETARINIEKYCEELEQEMLSRFDAAYRENDKTDMNFCAKFLFELNGGNSCVQAYVNQNEFFLNRAIISEDEFDNSDDIDMIGLRKLFDDIRTSFPAEWSTISVVFPNSIAVLKTFIQRIFAQLAGEVSPLLYLRTLASIHSSTLSLTNDLKRQGETLLAGAEPEYTLSATLDRYFDDLFVPYTDGDRYINIENTCLLQRLESVIAPFINHVINRKKLKNKSKQQPPLPAVGNLLTIVGFDGSKSPTSPTFPKPEDDPSQLSLKIILELIKMHLESAKRCRELSKQGVHAKNAGALFKVFVDVAGLEYILAAVEIAAEENMVVDTKSEPEVDNALRFVSVTSKTLQLIQLHFQTYVIPAVSSSPSAHREAIIIKNEFMSSIEDILNQLLQKQIDAILAWAATLLSKQKKGEFKPKDETFESNVVATQPCQQCCEFMRRICATAQQSLDSENLEVFLCDIGFAFHGMLLEHIKKFTFSYSGGVTLTKDLAKYYETMSFFKQPPITERFEMLREIGNLFIVKPENLHTVLSEGCLGRIEVQLLQPFLMTRSDWGRIQKYEVFSGSGGRLGHVNS